MRHDLATAPGLVRHAFVMQGLSTCFAFSIWESEQAIMAFSNVRSHITLLRNARRWCRAIWSAYWHLDAVSKFAHLWPGDADWPEMSPHPWHLNRLVPMGHPQEERHKEAL